MNRVVLLNMRKTEAKVLIIDDDEDVLFAARIYLKRFFSEVSTLSSPRKIISTFNESTYDVVLMDMNFQQGQQDGREGMFWFDKIKEVSPETVIVLMTAFAHVSVAVESIKKGAFDFVLKPWNNEKLLATIHSAVKLNRSLKKSDKLEQASSGFRKDQSEMVIGVSESFQQVLKVVQKVAATDANVLLMGANGTGKYVIAKLLHENSQRNKELFVHVDLGSLNENLFESELFGYAKGAFTDAKEPRMGRFEMAEKGTIFLDEIGNLSLNLQTKLLSIIQNRKVVRLGESKERHIDVRIICATNADLNKEVEEQNFREDLLYRINTIEITLPSLKDRKEDIPLFVDHFLEKNKKKYRKGKLQFSKDAMNQMEFYHWPGNIRELEHVVERAVILSEKDEISKEDLQFSNRKPGAAEIDNLNLEEMEVHLVKAALKKHTGNISKAAKELGITRNALYRRMEKFDL